eukprot:112510-Amphidinium_carterae.1
MPSCDPFFLQDAFLTHGDQSRSGVWAAVLVAGSQANGTTLLSSLGQLAVVWGSPRAAGSPSSKGQ